MREAQKLGNSDPTVRHNKQITTQARWDDTTFKDKMTKTCEHCNKSMLKGLYTRWHGINCKEKNNE